MLARLWLMMLRAGLPGPATEAWRVCDCMLLLSVTTRLRRVASSPRFSSFLPSSIPYMGRQQTLGMFINYL